MSPRNLTPSNYHAWRFDIDKPNSGPISSSLLKKFAELGPHAFRRVLKAPEKITDALRFGSILDEMVLTPQEPPSWMVWDNSDLSLSKAQDVLSGAVEVVSKAHCPGLAANGAMSTKKARAWKAEQLEAGREIISEDAAIALDQAKLKGERILLVRPEDKSRAEKLTERVRNHEVAAEVIRGARVQNIETSEADGIPLKGMMDIVPHAIDFDDGLADLKSFGLNLFHDDEIAKQVYKMRYHWQAALYLELWNRNHPNDQRREFYHIWASSVSHEVRVTRLPQQTLDCGRSEMSFWLARLVAECKSGPGFWSPFRRAVVELPPFTPGTWTEESRMEFQQEREQ